MNYRQIHISHSLRPSYRPVRPCRVPSKKLALVGLCLGLWTLIFIFAWLATWIGCELYHLVNS